MTPSIDELLVADAPETWRAAGFTVDSEGVAGIGTVRVRLVGVDGQRGIVGWALRHPEGTIDLDLDRDVDGDIDGLPTTVVDREPTQSEHHPNSVTLIDHLVVATPDCDRTTGALSRIGIEPRRSRDTSLEGRATRQTFFRLGEVILEVVGPSEAAGGGPARFWGLAYTVDDLDASASLLGDSLGPAKAAVQGGRMIATLRHEALGMSVATAFMSPDPRR